MHCFYFDSFNSSFNLLGHGNQRRGVYPPLHVVVTVPVPGYGEERGYHPIGVHPLLHVIVVVVVTVPVPGYG